MKQDKYHFFQTNFNSTQLLLFQLAILPPFFLINNIVCKSILVLMFYVFCNINNKRISITYNLMMMLSITFFNLLAPSGLVLFKVWVFEVTKDALLSGIVKSLNIIGMVFISLFCVQKDIKLPSKIGKLISIMFYYQQKISSTKYGKVHKDTILDDIDNYLFLVFEENRLESDDTINTHIKRTTKIGYLFIFAMSMFIYLLYFKGDYIVNMLVR